MRLRCWTLVPVLALACAKDAPPPRDSVAQSGNSDADVQWVPELGPLLAVPGDSDNTAIVLFPPSPEDAGSVTLMRTAGDSTSAARITPTDLQVCGDVATARLSSDGPSGWTIGLAPGATTLRTDSIESLSPADSSALATDVARLASAIPNDTNSPFVGLPFGVLAAHRITIDRATIVIARVARRIPQEAAPLEERTVLIAERQGRNPFLLKYSMRSAGAEDVVDHYLFLAALRAGARHFVILESERENGSRYDILERTASGVWQSRWSRVLAC